MDSQWTHNGLTTDSQWTHNGPTKDSQRTHTGFTPKSLKKHWFSWVVREKCCFSIGFTRLSATNVVFPLVLQGCPREMLFFHWFYKGCPREMVFSIGFIRKTRGQPADNPAGLG